MGKLTKENGHSFYPKSWVGWTAAAAPPLVFVMQTIIKSSFITLSHSTHRWQQSEQTF